MGVEVEEDGLAARKQGRMHNHRSVRANKGDDHAINSKYQQVLQCFVK